MLSLPKISSVNEQFAVTFAHVPTSANESTEECTTITLYVKPCGAITHYTPQGVVNYDAKGAAIAREKLKNTPKYTKLSYTLKAVEFQYYYRSLYGT